MYIYMYMYLYMIFHLAVAAPVPRHCQSFRRHAGIHCYADVQSRRPEPHSAPRAALCFIVLNSQPLATVNVSVTLNVSITLNVSVAMDVSVTILYIYSGLAFSGGASAEYKKRATRTPPSL